MFWKLNIVSLDLSIDNLVSRSRDDFLKKGERINTKNKAYNLLFTETDVNNLRA